MRAMEEECMVTGGLSLAAEARSLTAAANSGRW
jgi:hypothetical protein